MLRVSTFIDKLNLFVGRAAAWLIFVAVFISAYNAFVRKIAPELSSNNLLESQWILFGAVFLFCSPWTLFRNEHIRIDIVSSKMSPTFRNWVDILGHAVFLIPFCFLMVYTSVPFAYKAWVSAETSANATLPWWTAKALIPSGFFLLGLQGISELIKRIAVLRGQIPDTHHDDDGHGVEMMLPGSDGGQ